MTSPFSFNMPEKVTTMVLKSPQYVKAADGIDLAYYDFIPEKPSTVMIFYHGGGAWSMALYQYMARQLCEIYGMGVYLFDIRGHGNSQGPRGDASSAQAVWEDISTAIYFVKNRHVNAKIVLGGHSSGAGLVLNYSGWCKKLMIDGYVFLAPFLGSRSGTTYEYSDPSRRFIKEVRLFPLLVYVFTKSYFFDHTPVIFFNYPDQEKAKDSLLLESYTCAMAHAVTPNNPQQLFEKLDTPFLLLVGQDDEQFIPEKVIALSQSATRVIAHSKMRIMPSVTHLSVVIESPEFIAQEFLGALQSE